MLRDIGGTWVIAAALAAAVIGPVRGQTPDREPAAPTTAVDGAPPSPSGEGEPPQASPEQAAAASALDEERRSGERPSLLGGKVREGLFEYRYWTSGQSLDGLSMPAPVLVVGGIRPGPTLCLTGAIHGDELNGVEIIRRVLFGLEPEELNGTVIGIPIVNLHGFRRNSRYLADRRDLNRFFPGDARGSSAARIAHSLFNEVIRHCDYLVDIHTGSFQRTNLAQVRADLDNPSVLKFATMFGDITVLNHPGAPGTVRRAATDIGIAAATIEVGEPLRLQPDQVGVGVRGIKSVLAGLGMAVKAPKKSGKQAVFNESTWLRSDDGGILLSKVELGDEVTAGQVLGTVTDPITNRRGSIISPTDGRIIGMAINQVVMPGFAAFHLGYKPREKPAKASAVAPAPEAPRAPATEPSQRAIPDDDVPHAQEPAVEPERDDAIDADTEPEDHPE